MYMVIFFAQLQSLVAKTFGASRLNIMLVASMSEVLLIKIVPFSWFFPVFM